MHLLHLRHLDLSFNNMTTIDNNAFVGPCQLRSLNLTKCYLSANDLPKYKGLEYLEDLGFGSCSTTNLSALTFNNLTRLRRLDLSKNKMRYIDQEAFVGLGSLEILDLSQNELCLSELHPTVFQPLQSLVDLLIVKEDCSFTCKPLKTKLFLSTLKQLSIGVQDLPIDPITWGMTSLTVLSLTVSCNVTISGNSFLNVDNITNLSLLSHSRSKCATMMSDAFQNLLNLSTLFIRVEDLKTIPLMLSNALHNNCNSLRHCTLSITNHCPLPFEIEELFLKFKRGPKIVRDALQSLPKSLDTITITTYSICYSLDFNSVINSGFDQLSNLSMFKIEIMFPLQARQSNILDVSSNDHLGQTFRRKCLPFPANKHNITLFNDVHTEAEEGDKSERIKIKWKKIYHKLPKLDNYQSFSSHVNQPPKLDIPITSLKLDYSTNFETITFYDHHVVPLKVDSLDISFNTIYHIPHAFGKIFSQVRIIDLSNTEISGIADGTFQSITNLTHLDLNNNQINMFTKDTLFQNLTNLNYLNLAHNDISTVPKSMLKDARNLETLDLSSNQMVIINVDIYHTKLKTLDLSSNYIQFISNSYARQIEQLCKQSDLEVNLARNPLRCTCDNLEFFQLTVSCGLTLKDANLTYCEFANETRVALDNMNRILDDLERECKSKIPILVGSVAASICLLFLLVGALTYRYRWKLRYLYYASKLKWFQTTYDGAGYQRIFEYDAFVSYTDTNNAFVRDEMIPKLEVENNIRLCAHERDFIAGESVAFNISRAIHSSKRTILIFTEDFFRSNWCMYELNMARVEELYSDRNVILIIFLCDLDLDKISLDVLDLLRWKTYLKYPEQGTDRETFWGKCVEFIR